MLRKLFSSTIIYAFAPQIPRLINLFMTPLLTQHLTSYDYGINATILAYIGAFEGLKGLGLSLIFMNSFFQEPDNFKSTWKKLFGFQIVWAVIVGVLLIPIIYFILPTEEINNFVFIILTTIIPFMFLSVAIELGNMYLQLSQKPISLVSISMIASLFAIVMNYYTIVTLQMGYLGFLLSSCLSQLITFIIYFYLLTTKWKLMPIFKFDFNWLKIKIKLSAPTIPHYYSGFLLNTSDRVLLNILGTSSNDIGLYSFGYSFGTYFSVLGKGLAKAGTPIFLSLYKNNDSRSEKSVRNMLLISQSGLLFLGFVLSIWSKEIIDFLARSPTLKDSYLYMIPSVMAYTYFPIYFGAISKLRYAEKTDIFWKISFMAGVINIGLNLILIPLIGIMGAGLNTFISYMFMGFSGYFTKEFKELNQVNYYEKYWLVAICLSLILAFLMCETIPIQKIFVSFTAFIISLIVILKIKQTENEQT